MSDQPDHKQGGTSHAVLATLLATAVIAIVAFISYWSNDVLLAPSLGAAILTQLATPTVPAAKLWPIFAGQLCGVLGGFCAVHAVSVGVHPFSAGHPVPLSRVEAVIIAIAIACAAMFVLRALSPVGGATALVVALGTETANWDGLWRLVVGITLITVLGEIGRLVILHHRGVLGRS